MSRPNIAVVPRKANGTFSIDVRPMPLLEELLQQVEIIPWSGCWIWMGASLINGYGKLSVNGKQFRAHILVYTAIKGAVQKGLELDHLCRVHACVNPNHLDAVTHKENMLRGSVATKLSCKNGHVFTPKNTIIRKEGWRRCKQCAIAYENKRNRLDTFGRPLRPGS